MNRANAFQCSFCGYDLQGSPSGICPECGRPVLRFTARIRDVMAEANRQALSLFANPDPLQPQAAWWTLHDFRGPQITPSHLLLGILGGPKGIGRHCLEHLAVDLARLRELTLAGIPRASHRLPDAIKLPLSRGSNATIHAAIEHAYLLKHDWVGTEHLLLSLSGRRGDRSIRRSMEVLKITEAAILKLVIANIDAIQAARPHP